ncbi:hypothetical protein ACKS2F_000061 [Cronobacter dublinensis]|uniref:hypothetical protein n=1 Tax=Cronobacter turicensis TaxID=413502 RepID=UPI000CFB498A|nr:hypothetical protein [Cronobacter turicensis]
MDTENLFFCAGVFVLISIFACVAYVNHNDNATIAGMVKSGADPVAAHCAVKGITAANAATCTRAIAN